MNKFSKKRFLELAGLLNEEADVVDLTSYRREKEREKYHNEVVMSADGQIVSPTEEWKYVVITNRDQADALVDGDVEKAADLGAQFYEVAPGKEIELRGEVQEGSINERMSPEFGQDLVAYFGDVEGSPIKQSKKRCKKKNNVGIGTADVVDGPYREKSKKQPFDDDKHRKGFLKQLNIESLFKEEKYPETASEYALALNQHSSSPFKLVTDPDHWERVGVHTGEDLAKYLAIETYHNIYKDYFGIRPRHMNFDEMTVEQIDDAIDRLNEYLDEENQKEDESWLRNLD